MAFQFKPFAIAFTAVLAASLAQAEPLVYKPGPGGLRVDGQMSMSYSADMLATLDTGRVSVVGSGLSADASATITKDSDGFYTQVSTRTPFTSLTIESQSNEFSTDSLLGMSSSGGVTMVAPILRNVSSGGALTITDLNVDLVNRTVYATLTGGNGVGVLKNFALWNIGSITSGGPQYGWDRQCGLDCFYLAPNVTVSGLTATTDGFDKMAQSLGLQSLGKAALHAVNDFGAITTSVPEPGTWALMGLGLAWAGLLTTARSRSAGCNPARSGSRRSERA